MVAFFGLPGASQFSYAVVGTRGEGQRWLEKQVARHGETQESLNNLRQSRIVSNKEAAKWRWRDGSRIVDFDRF